MIIYCSQNPHYTKPRRVQTFLNFTFSFRYFLYSTLTNHFKFMKLSFLSSHTHNGCFFTELYSTSRNLLAKMVWFSKCKVPRSWYFGSCRFLPRLDAYLDLSQITFSFPKLGKQSLATKNLLVDIPAALSNARESLSFLFDVLQEG